MDETTFIVDCPWCMAKVAAVQKGYVYHSGQEEGEPFGLKVYLGSCPACKAPLVGESNQLGFEGFDSEEDYWSTIVRVFPAPLKTFRSSRVPQVVRDSLEEADRSLQANANIAACVMLGRALEEICRDVLRRKSLGPPSTGIETPPPTTVSLAASIEILKDANVIDQRLYAWSQELRAFRNLSAHPEAVSVSRENASDLQTFLFAIVEYIYDLTDRYDEFMNRNLRRRKEQNAADF